MSRPWTADRTVPGLFRAGTRTGELDERIRFAAGLRRQVNKVFPTQWSFMLGEIALYSFVVLVLSGTYLALFFEPSLQDVTYHGVYTDLWNVHMSRAYATTLDLSFEVRGGLLTRQVHHWAALLFMASIIVHMMRIFFTGAFRKPRETNWVIGITLATLGLAEGFAGYSLPDDLLSGTGLRIMSGIILSIPVIGTWLSWLVFGGEYPGFIIDSRLYIAHVLLIPGLLAALVGLHLLLVWHQKHTQFPGVEHGVNRTEHNVVGVRIMPAFALKSGAFFVAVVGVLAFMGGVFQINPVWNYGPYATGPVSMFSQPDWYVGWLEGALRLMPSWLINFAHRYQVPPAFWPGAVLPLALISIVAVYPMIERRLTGDRAYHNLLQRPRDVPVRTSLGAMTLTFVIVLLIVGGDDVIAARFDISVDAMVWAGRVSVFVLPAIVYYVTYRVCVGLERSDRHVLEHGVETGIIRRLPHGAFVEVHQPLGPLGDDGRPVPLRYQGSAVPKKMNTLGAAGRSVPGLLRPDPAGDSERLALSREQAEAEWASRADEFRMPTDGEPED